MTAAQANTPLFRNALTMSLAELLSIAQDAITINSIVDITGRRRLLAGSVAITYSILTTYTKLSMVSLNLNTISTNGELTSSLNSNPYFTLAYPGVSVVAVSFPTESTYKNKNQSKMEPGILASLVIISIIGVVCVTAVSIYYHIRWKNSNVEVYMIDGNEGMTLSSKRVDLKAILKNSEDNIKKDEKYHVLVF